MGTDENVLKGLEDSMKGIETAEDGDVANLLLKSVRFLPPWKQNKIIHAMQVANYLAHVQTLSMLVTYLCETGERERIMDAHNVYQSNTVLAHMSGMIEFSEIREVFEDIEATVQNTLTKHDMIDRGE